MIIKDIRSNKTQFGKIVGLIGASLLIGAGIPFWVIQKGEMFPGLVAHLAKLHINFDILICLQPFVMVGVTLTSLLFEVYGLGYEHSTLKRLITTRSNSLLNDLFYFTLRVAGIIPLIAFAITLGNLYIIKEFFTKTLSFNVLFSIPAVFHIIPVALFHSFAFYVYHRLMHTKYFWEIHKVHHSAEDFNVLLPYRNHPVDFLFAQIIIPSFIAMLGAHPVAVFTYLLLNSFYQSMVHSEFAWNIPWLNKIFITPEAHKIHHASDSKYFDTNFGILTIWDQLFGTYRPPEERIEKIGIHDRGFNTGHPFTEMCNVFLRWIGIRKK